MSKRSFLITAFVLVCSFSAYAEEVAEGPYSPDWQSLQAHTQAPEWFRDAKFGIYFHWGVYSVPAYGDEWYPRNMHIEKSSESRHHIKTYGNPSEFGYHDFVPMFKAENFNAEAWADLFAKAGAQFAGPVAEHHDGFAMWDSALTPWNAKDKGPMRDILGELSAAVRAKGMRLVTTFHHARNNQHLINRNGELVWEGHYPRVSGWPTVSENPELRMLYGNLPRLEFCEIWLGKLQEVIDGYQPDLIWFDSWLDEIPETYQMKFVTHYLNRAKEWNKDVVITCKQRDLPLEVALEDFEKGRADSMLEEPWLTDDTLSYGSWCYTQDLKIKPADEVLDVLIDIVSKNGQLLLNISPMADGTIPQDQQDVLQAIGKWLVANGEAIYNTRPFLTYGEGPTQMKKGGHFVGIVRYTNEDIRYTRNGNIVYAILLGRPENSDRIKMTVFGEEGTAKNVKVKNVSLLGTTVPVIWKQMNSALIIECPDAAMDDMAVVFKIETDGF
jgi:alpha-L-fucosidase